MQRPHGIHTWERPLLSRPLFTDNFLMFSKQPAAVTTGVAGVTSVTGVAGVTGVTARGARNQWNLVKNREQGLSKKNARKRRVADRVENAKVVVPPPQPQVA